MYAGLACVDIASSAAAHVCEQIESISDSTYKFKRVRATSVHFYTFTMPILTSSCNLCRFLKHVVFAEAAITNRVHLQLPIQLCTHIHPRPLPASRLFVETNQDGTSIC